MDHDQIWKLVINTFFEDFLKLFYSKVAEQVDFSTVQPVPVEVFTNLPEGSRREPDIVLRISTNHPEPFLCLFHIEVQATRRPEMAHRMHQYYHLIAWSNGLPVFPILIYLEKGAGGLADELDREKLFGYLHDVFSYHTVGLPDLGAQDYIDRNEPFAAAVSSLMKTPAGGRVDTSFEPCNNWQCRVSTRRGRASCRASSTNT